MQLAHNFLSIYAEVAKTVTARLPTKRALSCEFFILQRTQVPHTGGLDCFAANS